jgi:hypothetical protein
MMADKLNADPVLAKPGAGLPIIEWAVAKYIMLPRLYKSRDKQGAIDAFTKESKKILDKARSVDHRMLTERRLVPRLQGLEDSSRYWSIAMTLQHLIIVTDLMREAVVQLSTGGTTLRSVGTAEVKPDPNVDAESIFEKFERITDRFLKETGAANIDAFPNATHPHPWFGPLNAHQWLIFGGLHTNIHRKQVEAIIARL